MICERPRCRIAFASTGRNQRFCSPRCQQLDWYRRTGHQWRTANPKEYAAAVRRMVEKIKRVVAEAKAKPCEDCGTQYASYVMDFDHVRGVKKFCVGHGAFQHGLKATLAEIQKCEVVCSNCHRERTHRRRIK